MRIVADLHIHSPYSRATSPKLTPPYLERWARIKGLDVLGTGDCTHPRWLKTLREQLDDAETGMYTLRETVREEFNAGAAQTEHLPAGVNGKTPRFVLTGEISTIYKKNGKTRKVHHLVLLPDFKSAAAFQIKLERLGNISSDGRPILGVDSRDLLATLLDADERALLIPAHIWTPWFSALGANSGFDSIGECYGDLSRHITAIETGLSSNPPMNWSLSSLDRFSVISNSDAHSPEKLGREATVFDLASELSLPALLEALQINNVSEEEKTETEKQKNRAEKNKIEETIEFFPQEGKYHYDGHRKCGACLTPEETLSAKGVCPVCGKALTQGVMSRVLALADRPVDETAAYTPGGAANRRPYCSLIPLKELLGELLDAGPGTKKVETAYHQLVETAGELTLLKETPIADLAGIRGLAVSGELLAHAVARMRAGEVSITPGYDGEYGVIRAFPPGEAEHQSPRLWTGLALEENPAENPVSDVHPAADERKRVADEKKDEYQAADERKDVHRVADAKRIKLDPEQERAVYGEGACALVIAGPGTGKTAVLAARIAHLIDRGMDPGSVLAVSFTVKASAELRERIIRTAGFRAEAVTAVTFHSFCAAVLREEYADAGLPADFTIITAEDKARILQNITQKKQNQGLSRYIEARKRALLHPGETVFPKIPRNWTFEPLPIDEKYEKYYGLYQSALVSAGFTDFDGLLTETVRLFTANPAILARWRDRYQAVFADEYQDVNFAQYILLFYIASPSLDFLHSPKEFLEENEKRAEEKKPEVSGKQEKPESVEKKEAEGKKKLWVVGDPNQGIYGFRGADRRFIDRFLADYPSAEVFNLSRSFRCGEAITGAAGLLMQVSLRGTDFNAALFRAKYPTDRAEADAIARRIAGLIGGTSFHAIDSGLADGASSLSGLSSCAILLRTLSLAEPFTQALQNYGIPFRLSRETPYLSTEPIASLIATLRDYAKRENAEKKEITGKERKKPASAVDEALKQLTLPKFSADRAKNARESLDRLRDIAEHYRDLTDFLDALAVDAEDGSVDIEPDGVRIMTIHGSKGLEFEHIFVPALEEGILPFTLYEPLSADRLEEEKRLLYVAMTRAKRGLYLSYAQKRFFQNRLLEYGRSRFFDVLEAAVPVFPAEKPQRKAKPQDPQMRLF